MAFKFSTGLKNSILGVDPLTTLLTDGYVKLYGGTVPPTADALVSAGSTLLVTYSNAGAVGAGNGLNFDVPSSGTISKDPAQVWSGVAGNTGTATYFRFVAQADTGTDSTVEVRIQGTVGGAGADMFVQSNSITSTTNYTIDYFTIAIPSA
jgi:hypothetical protein